MYAISHRFQYLLSAPRSSDRRESDRAIELPEIWLSGCIGTAAMISRIELER